MRIAQLQTTGVRGLRDGAWSIDPDRGGAGHATVVTGPPQAGLTTFLDAIALTASRLAVGGIKASAADALRSGGTAATLRTTWWLDADERADGGTIEESFQAEVVIKRDALGRADGDPALLALMSRYDHAPTLSKVVSIPALRLTDSLVPSFIDFTLDQQTKRFADGPEKFASIPNALARHALGLGERARFDDVQRLFHELCSSVRLVGAGPTMEPTFQTSSGLLVPLGRLSFTERNALILAAVPVLLGLQRSVILLDTPELGLAPGAAGRWLDALRAYAPGAQWIVASRDPAVLASVEGSARIELTPGVA